MLKQTSKKNLQTKNEWVYLPRLKLAVSKGEDEIILFEKDKTNIPKIFSCCIIN